MPNRAAKTASTRAARLPRTSTILARVLDSAALGMLVCGLDGQIVYTNHAMSELLGQDIETGTNLLELIHRDDSGAGHLQLQRLMRGESFHYRGEHRFCHADGNPIWVLVAASVVPVENGSEPELVVVQVSNIELQKRAEEALIQTESRWNFALESARQGVWDHDTRTDAMFYSRAWRVMRGMAPDETVPADHHAQWLSRIHPDDLPRVKANLKRQEEGDESLDSLEYRERRRDGSYVWILSRGKPVAWDEDGNVLRALGTDTDITHLKTIEQELAEEKERLRVTLDSIADGMISTDETGHVVFMNPAAEQLTGYRLEEAKGREVRTIFALRDGLTGEKKECPVAICLAQDEAAHLDDDMLLVARTGYERDIRCTAAPVRTPAGQLSGAVLVFQDVTQSRAMQRQLAHSANHDELTQLPNRAAFDRALNGAIAATRDGPRRHCLLYIDLDRFKPVNDTAGHAAGDELLRQVAQTIRSVCREHDIAARIGGDEFAVLLQDCGRTFGQSIADRIVRAIGSLEFSWTGRSYRIGASVGLTQVGSQPSSPLGFMAEADAACYAAKAAGRGIAIAFGDL
jgi:diguanylate cyclase (GGDEF)-like protein/PAS domain S-box-containing protein